MAATTPPSRAVAAHRPQAHALAMANHNKGDTMPRKPAKAASTPNSTSHLFARQSKAKDQSRSMTSETIADDLLAFRKQGGRVEVLGITPLRMHVNVTTSRSKAGASKTSTSKTTPAKAAASKTSPERKTGAAATTNVKVAAAR
jgi:hypothetical protein